VAVAPDQARSRHLAEVLGMTESLRENQYPSLARIINMITGGGYEHPHNKDYTQISQSTWMNFFSHDREAVETVKNQLLDTLDSYQPDMYSKGYKLKLSMRARLDDADKHYEHVSDGEARLKPRHGQRPGRASVVLEHVPNFISVDNDAIANVLSTLPSAIDVLEAGGGSSSVPTLLQSEVQDLFAEKRGNAEAVIRYLKDTQTHLNDVVAYVANPVNRGMLPQAFKPMTCGRWEGVDFNLQNVHGLARRVALAGHYSYDISSCYQSIASQLCEQDGLILEGLAFYIENKKTVRDDLDDYIDVTKATIKEVLIALGYGASEYGDTVRALLTTKQRRTLQAHPVFRQLANDMDVAMEHIAATADITANGSKVRNVLGYGRDLHFGKDEQRERISDAKITAHVCFGFEAAALMAMTEAADTPVLTVHDCIICQRPEDQKKLEAAILERTGLSLKLDPEPERYPDWQQ